MSYRFKPVDESIAQAILAWQHLPPQDFVNPDPSANGRGVEPLLDPANGYRAIVDEGDASSGIAASDPMRASAAHPLRATPSIWPRAYGRT